MIIIFIYVIFYEELIKLSLLDKVIRALGGSSHHY